MNKNLKREKFVKKSLIKKRSSKRNSNKNRNQKSKMKLKTLNVAHIGGNVPLLEFNPLTQRKTIACGFRFNVVINNDGTLTTWGDNQHNQLNGVPERRNAERAWISHRFIAVACGATHSVALTSDGNIRCWGDNSKSQLDDVPSDSTFHPDPHIAIACGLYHSMALTQEGFINYWPMEDPNTDPHHHFDRHEDMSNAPQEDGYIAIACGYYHNVALKNDGTIKCWIAVKIPEEVGRERVQRALSDSPTDNGYIMIACGGYHSVALKNDGTIECWGDNTHGQCDRKPDDSGYIMIACGSYHSVALKNDGTIKCWGNNVQNQLDGPIDNGYIMIECGFSHSLALKNDGSIKFWGAHALRGWARPQHHARNEPVCTAQENLSGRHFMTLEHVSFHGVPRVSFIAIACGKCWHQPRPLGRTAERMEGIRTDFRDSPNQNYLMSPTLGIEHPGNTTIDEHTVSNISHSLALRGNSSIKCWGRNFYKETQWLRVDNQDRDGAYLNIPNSLGGPYGTNTPASAMIGHSEQQLDFMRSCIAEGELLPFQGEDHSINNHLRRTRTQQLIQQERREQTQQPVQQERREQVTSNVPSTTTNVTSTTTEREQLEQPVQQERAPAAMDPVMWRARSNIFIDSSRPSLYIDRKNVFESLKTHIKDNYDFFNKGTYIKFVGEAGIDQGGLTREFFALLSKELQENYFQVYHNDISSIGKEQEENAESKDIEDYYIIGQIFAYAIKSKNNINIKLNPLILDFLINSGTLLHRKELDITNTELGLLIHMFDTLSADNITKILKLINNEIIHKKRHHSNLDTLDKVKKIFNDYDPNILANTPYNAFLTLNKSDWSNNAKICLDEPGATCVTYENYLDVPFTKKDIYLLFIIKNFAFTRFIAEFYEFIDGFNSIIQLDKLKSLNIKQLNKLIVGDRSLNIDDFLRYLQVEDADDKSLDSSKSSLVKNFITEESKKKDDYLNKLLYLITASESLPFNGWDSFKEREFRIVFVKNIDSVRSHTCDGFKFVEIPESVLKGTNEEIKEKLNTVLSYDSVVASSQSAICMAGGGI